MNSTLKAYYKAGYKYQLARDYSQYVGVFPDHDIETAYLRLTRSGFLTCKNSYAWDGASGPTWDTPDTIRASLVHDGLYQLIRLGLIPMRWRGRADLLLRDILLADGMHPVRAEIWYMAVSHFAHDAALPEAERPVLEAPRYGDTIDPFSIFQPDPLAG